MKIYIIIGPPGAGKGTQSKIICNLLNINQLSTGNIFRENIKGKTKLGLEVLKYINGGILVPDELTDKLVFDKLDNDTLYKNGVLLDGYPRNISQISALENYLKSKNEKIKNVINLQISNSLIIKRLLKRAKIENRADDTEKIINERIAVYEGETAPIIDYFDKKNILVTIDGTKKINDVTNDILKVIK
jgi:adenylate kinase